MLYEHECPEHGVIPPQQINYDGHRCSICGRQLIYRLVVPQGLDDGPLGEGPHDPSRQARNLRAGALALEVAAAQLDHAPSSAFLRKRAGEMRRTAVALEDSA